MTTLHSSLYSSRLKDEGQIRLLKILPAAYGSREIKCQLETVHLDENPSYIALSYTWGPPTAEAAYAGVTDRPTHDIICNGDTIQITQNLYDFLQRVLRNPELYSHRFWIDSICINQQDGLERSSQVSFMASIYRSADMVIAWLGEEDANTKDSFALIKTLASLPDNSLQQIFPKNRDSEVFAKILGPFANDRFWLPLQQFMRRNYFRRGWIIQEVALAKMVIAKCGGHVLRWDHLIRMSFFLTVTPWARVLNSEVHDPASQEYSSHALPLYLDANGKSEKGGNVRTLLLALIRARRFQCSDPRDKVYALLGLEQGNIKEKPRLRPMYGNRSVVDTFVSTAIQILEDSDDLLLLAYVEGQDFQTLESALPSWVPDWSCEKSLGLGIVGYKRFAASGNLPRKLEIDEPNNYLTIRGLRLDQVVQVGESKAEALIHTNPPHFPRWISILDALPPTYHTRQPKIEAFWRTLITDTAARIPHPVRHPAADEFKFGFRDWLSRISLRWIKEASSMEKTRFLEGIDRLAASEEAGFFPSTAEILDSMTKDSPPDSSNDLANGHDPPDADDYNTILNHSFHTRLLRTSSHYLAIATTSVREGDWVWIVPGSPVPLIFRECGPRNEHCLVGGAYVHGLMQGEALMPDVVLMDIKVV